MLLSVILNPGIVTLMYPISIFGYALMEESRPRKEFWFLVILYTQILILVQVILSMSFLANPEIFPKDTIPNIKQAILKYYLGVMIVDGDNSWSLMINFLPLVLILWAAMTFNHNEIILGLHESKE